jgi:hypothetical protein
VALDPYRPGACHFCRSKRSSSTAGEMSCAALQHPGTDLLGEMLGFPATRTRGTTGTGGDQEPSTRSSSTAIAVMPASFGWKEPPVSIKFGWKDCTHGTEEPRA